MEFLLCGAAIAEPSRHPQTQTTIAATLTLLFQVFQPGYAGRADEAGVAAEGGEIDQGFRGKNGPCQPANFLANAVEEAAAQLALGAAERHRPAQAAPRRDRRRASR